MAASRIGTQYIFLARIVARGRLDDGDSLARGFEGRRVRPAKIQGCTIGLDWLVPRGRVRFGACGVVVVVQSRDAGVGLMAGLFTHALVAFCLARAERRLVLGTEHFSSG